MTGALPELLSVVVIQVNSALMALATTDVDKFVLIDECHRIPLSPPGLGGVVLVDERPSIVVDLSVLVASPSHVGSDGFPRLGVLCRTDRQTVVLTGCQVRSIGPLRAAVLSERAQLAFCIRGAEWRGETVPLLSIPRLVDFVTASLP